MTLKQKNVNVVANLIKGCGLFKKLQKPKKYLYKTVNNVKYLGNNIVE